VTNIGEVVRLLAESRVRFILIGGAAANVYGSARHTEDIDVVYDRRPENVERLVTALRPFRPTLRGAPEGLPFVWDERTIRSGLNFTLSTSLGAVDLLKRAAGRRKDLEAIAELEAIREEREKTGLR
jgi:hypothetical protein